MTVNSPHSSLHTSCTLAARPVHHILDVDKPMLVGYIFRSKCKIRLLKCTIWRWCNFESRIYGTFYVIFAATFDYERLLKFYISGTYRVAQKWHKMFFGFHRRYSGMLHELCLPSIDIPVPAIRWWHCAWLRSVLLFAIIWFLIRSHFSCCANKSCSSRNADAVLRWDFCPSVCLSVCPSVKRVHCDQTVESYV